MNQRADAGDELGLLLEYLKSSRGFDFTNYKRPTLERRINKRMSDVGIATYPDYRDFLEANPREFTELFNTILINVTGFFRDRPVWDHLAKEIVPRVLEAVPGDSPVRVWSAGCASGEEPYSLAILLLEALGEEAFRDRVKIYATDVDEDALITARAATYPADALDDLEPRLVERYFTEAARGMSFRSDLRRSVIFGRNELLHDAPISRVDLLVCRNVLMYFTPEAQARILSQFNFALNDHGYLFVGKSEMLIRHSAMFNPASKGARVFQRVPQTGLRERLSLIGDMAAMGQEAAEQRYAHLREAAVFVGPEARVVVDSNRLLVDANQRARELFGLRHMDIGRPIQDLELSYRPVELRSHLDQAFQSRRAVAAGRTPWGPPDNERILEIEVTPIDGTGELPLGAAVTFSDVTDFAHLADQHAESTRRLETAYEELQSTVEELETTNEELQSTNEELETTNEELQSANEELQTMNEELSSTNDELEAMNETHREHSRELDRLNLFLEGILGNLGLGVVVVDQHLRVQLWNESATDLWGLRAGEVDGQDLLALDIGLPVAELREPLARALGATPRTSDLRLEAINRRGRSFECEVRVLPLVTAASELYGAVVLLRDAADGS